MKHNRFTGDISFFIHKTFSNYILAIWENWENKEKNKDKKGVRGSKYKRQIREDMGGK